MGDDIKIGNPHEVLARILHESKLLSEYSELLNYETREFSRLEGVIAETEQTVNARIRQMHTVIEQYRNTDESQDQQDAIAKTHKQLEFYENQLHTVKQCKEDLLSMQQDYMSLIKECNYRSDSGRVLAGKLEILINKIIDAK